MPTEDKALRERLDEMYETFRKNMGPAKVPWGFYDDLQERDALEAVALDLLKRLEEREMPCEWTFIAVADTDCLWSRSCGEKILGDPSKFCPGCGHPVEVKEAPHV